MLDLERNEQILAILKENKACTVYELSQKLFVSESTIRRDLSRMEQKGLVTRTFGGAILKSNPIMEDTSFFLREKENLQDKRALVKEALPFIQDNMAIFVDSSTTCLQMATMLNEFSDLIIITNGLALANELVTKTRHHVTLLGGDIQPAANSCLGSYAEAMVSEFHAALCILSTSGADAEFGFSEHRKDQAALKRLMIKNADQTIVLVDKKKIGKKCLAKTVGIDKVQAVITSGKVPDSFRQVAPETQFIEVA